MTYTHTPQIKVLRVDSGFSALLIFVTAVTLFAQTPQANLRHYSESGTAAQRSARLISSLDSSLFLPPVVYAKGGLFAGNMVVGDVNGDGKPDLIGTVPCVDMSCTSNGFVSALLGNGDGTFQEAALFSSGGRRPSGIAVADVNGDGLLDVVITNSDSSTVGILLGNGGGTFRPVVTYPSGGPSPMSVAISDVNRDGNPDLIITYFRNVYYGAVSVLLGRGDGTFQAPTEWDIGAPRSVFVADVNGDGSPDLIVAHYNFYPDSGKIHVLLGNGDGTFKDPVSYESGGTNPQLAVADINGDGKIDIVAANCGPQFFVCPVNSQSNALRGVVAVFLGNGDGTFQSPVIYDSGGYFAASVAIADVNADGKPDSLVGNSCASTESGVCVYAQTRAVVAVLPGNGDGTFKPAQTYDAGGAGGYSIAAADLNGDGKLDVVAAITPYFYTSWVGEIGVLLNNTPFCMTPPIVTLSATPSLLWPPNGQMVPITISGTITDSGTGCSVQTVAYAVKDEYGKVQPSGPVTLGSEGAYSFTVWLQASRLGTDLDGRLYTVSVSATNNTGKTGSQTSTIIAPHDQGR